MKNNDQRSSLFWLGVGLAIAVYAQKYGLGTPSSPGAGFLPFLSGVAIAVLAVIVFLQQFRHNKKRDTLARLWAHSKWHAVPLVMGALVLYAVCLRYLGFVLDTLILTAFLLRMLQPLPWIKVLAGSAAATLGSYLVFEVWLEAQLPAGVFGF